MTISLFIGNLNTSVDSIHILRSYFQERFDQVKQDATRELKVSEFNTANNLNQLSEEFAKSTHQAVAEMHGTLDSELAKLAARLEAFIEHEADSKAKNQAALAEKKAENALHAHRLAISAQLTAGRDHLENRLIVYGNAVHKLAKTVGGMTSQLDEVTVNTLQI